VHSDGKSHSGVAVSYGSGPLFVSSRKQGIVTKSSTEAELVATSDVSGLVYDVLGTLRDLGETVPHAVVHQDNQSSIRSRQESSHEYQSVIDGPCCASISSHCLAIANSKDRVMY
jgi:hypothetical protein